MNYEITINKIDLIMNEIHKSIHDLIKHYGGYEKDFRIAMPKYFENIIYSHYTGKIQNPFKKDNNEPTFVFGIVVVPNYQNNIVVFHENGTLHKEPFYKTIEI